MAYMKFYLCKHCGNIITFATDAGVPVLCCGEKMQPIAPNSTEAAGEKHVPVVKTQSNTVMVDVGSVRHPMEDKHHIGWICLETSAGYQMQYLAHDAPPVAIFALPAEEKPLRAYAYCNLHGLWECAV